MFRSLTNLSIAITALLCGACHEPMTVAAEAQAHEGPAETRGGAALAAPDPENTPEPNEAPVEQANTDGEGAETMTDEQAEDLLREDWLEEQPPEGANDQIGAGKTDDEDQEDDTLRGSINLNTATLDDLMLLPGVGPATAARIADYRKKRRFKKPIHLKRIKGIGPKTWADLKPYVAVDGKTTLSD